MLDSRPVDLHCHSTASDGSLTPMEVVRLAAERGLGALALTDHDTVAGVAQAAEEARRLGIELLPALEVSCAFPRPGTLHILAYGVDPQNPALTEMIDTLAAARKARGRLMVQRLAALGIGLDWEELVHQTGTASLGRPHLAEALVRGGHVASRREAFDRYLGGGGSAYVDTAPLEPHQVIAAIREAGGLAVLAHPLQLRRETPRQLEALVAEFADQGLEALEVMHGSHSIDDVHRLTRMADRLGLLTTGGSDFHGPGRTGSRLGEAAGREIPRLYYDQLLERISAGV